MLKVKYKKLHPDANPPIKVHKWDGAYDLSAISEKYDKETDTITYGTGLAFEIPDGYTGLLFMRSSVYKTSLDLSNAVGVLDSSYRGEVMAKFRIHGEPPATKYNVGDRVVQLMLVKNNQVEFQEVEKLNDSARGTGGHGSTGVTYGEAKEPATRGVGTGD